MALATGVLVAVAVAGSVAVSVLAARAHPPSSFGVGADLHILVSAVWMITLAIAARPLALGRTTSVGLVFAGSLFPAIFVEVYGLSRLSDDRVARAAAYAEGYGVELLAEPAFARFVAYALTAACCAIALCATASFVLTIDPRIGPRDATAPARRAIFSGGLGAGLLGVAFAIGLGVLRVRSPHRDGLGGALPIGGLVGVAVLAHVLAKRCALVGSWHDPRERTAVIRAATAAIGAALLGTLAIERAVLAADEYRALAALAGDLGVETIHGMSASSLSFDARFERAQALASAWSDHPAALVTIAVAGAFLFVGFLLRLPTKRILAGGASAAPRAFDRCAVGLSLAAVLGCVGVRELRVRRVLVAAPVASTPPGIALPVAPGAPPRRPGDALRVAFGPDHALVPETAAASRAPFVFVADRSDSAFAIIGAARQLDTRNRWGALLVESARPALAAALGPASALVGPSRSAFEFGLPRTMGEGKAGGSLLDWEDVLVIVDDGEVGRIIRRRVGGGRFVFDRPRGVSFRTDPESIAARRRLRHDAMASVILLAPHPRADAQALVDAMIAARELSPRAVLLLTTDREEIEHVFEGPAIAAY